MEYKNIDDSQYMVIKQLPTNFRSYKDISEIYIRGLYYPEALSLAKYIGHGRTDMSQLAMIYKNAIQGIDVYQMEIADFIIATIISSIYTQKSFGWVPNIRCPHIVKNPMIEKTNDRIRVLTEVEEKTEEQIEELEALIFSLNDLEPLAPCKGVVNETIVLDDLEFYEPNYENKIPISHIISGKEYKVAPLTLMDIIKIDSVKDDESYDEIMYSYSRLIKDELSDDNKYKVIAKGNFGDIQELEEIDKNFKINIKPVIKTCPVCKGKVHIKLGLLKLKANP